MFRKKNRLTKTKEIENVFKNGKRSYSNTLGFRFLKNQLEYNRFCVIISAKVSKKAVIRNKIKRQIRAVVETENKLMLQGFDFLIITNKEILDKDFLEVKESIKDSFKVLKLYV
ncbi:MAG: ribonuclease P protein component [Patescibacteria group bacterium]